MIDVVVRSFLGKWGSAALDFYIANSLWINLVLVIYLIALIWSQRTYKKIYSKILTDLVKDHGAQYLEKNHAALVKMLTREKFGWESLGGLNKFPFITAPKSYLIQFKNEQTLRKLFSPEKLAKLIVERNQSNKKV